MVKLAKDAEQSSRGANTGTAFHSYVRQINAGTDVKPLDQHEPALDAYRRAVQAHGVEPVRLEQFVVWPANKIAGSCDICGRHQGALRVLDLKIGQHNPADW